MNISKEQKKAEAIKRMKMLDISPLTIKQFEEKNCVSISESPLGAFYLASGKDLRLICEFEKEHNALVYLVVRTYTTIGRMDCYMFVSDDEDDWEQDCDDLENKEAFCFVYNHKMPECSEFGSIGVKRTRGAGLLRVW